MRHWVFQNHCFPWSLFLFFLQDLCFTSSKDYQNNVSNSTVSPPYLRLSIFTLALYGIIYLVKRWRPELVYPHILFLMAFFLGLFLITYFILNLSFESKDKKNAVILNIVAVVIRLLICIVAAYLFMKFDPENHRSFIITFLVIYLCYLGFEIYSILSNLRPHLKS